MPERTCDRGMIGSPAAAEDTGSSSAATVRAIRRTRMERAGYPRASRLPALSTGELTDGSGKNLLQVRRSLPAEERQQVLALVRAHPLADRVVRHAVAPPDRDVAALRDL